MKKDKLVTTISLKMLLNPQWYKDKDPWKSWLLLLRERLSRKEYYVRRHRNALEGVSKHTVEIWKRAR
jgi:hypothetical protein